MRWLAACLVLWWYALDYKVVKTHRKLVYWAKKQVSARTYNRIVRNHF